MVYAAESANDPVFDDQALGNSRKRRRDSTNRDSRLPPTNQTSNISVTSITTPSCSEAVENVCGDNLGIKVNLYPFCNKTQDLHDCVEFQKKTMDKRKSFLYKKKLCFSCYENRSCIKRLRKEAHLQEVQEMAPNGTAHCTLHIDVSSWAERALVTNPRLRKFSL